MSSREAVSPRIARSRAMAAVALVAGLAIWAVERRWSGLGNDGALYTVLALDHLDPSTFGGDLLIRYGSQDPFTVFPALYATAIAALGLTNANLVLLLIAYALWLTGAWRLTHALARGWPAHLAFLAVTAAPLSYGAWQSFGAGESVLTPRPFAEAFCLLAVSWLVVRSWWKAAAASALAALFHPAVALAGLVAGFLVLAQRWRVLWFAAPVGGATVMGLAFAGVAPFAGLLTTMGGIWLATVKLRTAYVFLASWMAGDYARTMCDASLCFAAALVTYGDRRRALIAVTATAVAGVAATGVGADLLHNTFATQLQTWRFAWLMGVVKWPAAALVWMRLRKSMAGSVATAFLIAPAFITLRPFSDQPWAWGPALAMCLSGLILAWLVVHGRAPAISHTVRRLAVEAAFILPLANLGDGFLGLGMDVFTRNRIHAFPQDPTGLFPVRLALACAGASVILLARGRPRVAKALAFAGFCTAALFFDNRSAFERYEMSSPTPLRLPPGAEVIWDSEATPTWVLLRQPTYFSAMQASGLVLSRAAAEEWTRRRRLMQTVMPLTDFRLDYKVAPCSAPDWRPDLAGVSLACRRAPSLAGVIVDRPLDSAAEIAFATPVLKSRMCGTWPNIGLKGVSRFYYVPCDRLRLNPR